MARAVKRPAESWTYILRDDRELSADEQSVWTLKPMTHIERAEALDNLVRTHIGAGGEKTVISRSKQQAFEIVLTHLVAVRNFPARAGKPWPAKETERVAYIEQMDDAHVRELADEIFDKSTLAGDDGTQLKNSSPPERTSPSGESGAETTSTGAPHAS
jgi:hypothetical protein